MGTINVAKPDVEVVPKTYLHMRRMSRTKIGNYLVEPEGQHYVSYLSNHDEVP